MSYAGFGNPGPFGPPTALSSLTVSGVPTIGGGGIPITFGNYWFVDAVNGSDGNTGMAMNNAFATIQRALDKCITNNDDVILIRGGSTGNAVSAMLDITINRVHLVGLDGAFRAYGQGARVTFAGSSGATNIAVMRNTGVRNSFTNLKFDNESAITQSIYSVVEGGEYAQYNNCEVYLGTNLDNTSAAEFVWNGDSTQMNDCTIGSLANILAGSSIRRPCVLLSKGLAGSGKVCRDGLMRNTRMWRNSIATANLFMYAAAANDVERVLNLEHCGFINNGIATTIPAVCIGLGATLTTGQIVLDPTCYASNVTKIATATGVLVSGPAPNSGTGIATNAA